MLKKSNTLEYLKIFSIILHILKQIMQLLLELVLGLVVGGSQLGLKEK